MVVAQLAERSLPIPEIRGSNPVTGKILCSTRLLLSVEKKHIKKKAAGIGRFLQKSKILFSLSVAGCA